ncbi:MAG: ATP-binding protein [Oscillospiraceae bacterium]
MKYSREAFEKAERELESRRRKAEEEQLRRTAEIASVAPEVEILQRKLKSTGFRLMSLIVYKEKDSKQEIEKIKRENLDTQNTIGELLEAVKGDRNYLDVKYYCPICGDTGYVQGRRCSCMEELLKQFTAQELNENCLIELHDFSQFRLDYYDKSSQTGISPYEKMQGNLQYCKSYAENFSQNSPSLFFFGKTGLGKTFLSSCIAKTLLDRGVNVVFGSLIDFLRKIENEHFGRAEGNTLDVIIGAELVILDDLGSEFQTGFTESAIYDIINSRINLGRPTIVSTNLSRSELSEKYNERIISRLTGCFLPLGFMGKDIRHLKLRNNNQY